jgi:hypothetical protein
MPIASRADVGSTSADLAVVFVHGYMCLSPAIYWAGLSSLRRRSRSAGSAW